MMNKKSKTKKQNTNISAGPRRSNASVRSSGSASAQSKTRSSSGAPSGRPVNEPLSSRRTSPESRARMEAARARQAAQKVPGANPVGSVSDPSRRPQRKPAPKKKQKRRRRASMRFYYTIMILFILIVGVILCLTVFFKIERIEITGKSPYNTAQVEEVLQVKKGENLFLSNLSEAKNRLERELPYIESAVLTRRLPDEVTVEITEAVPVATIMAPDGSQGFIVSGTGKVLELTGSVPEGLVKVIGVQVASHNVGEKIQYEAEEVHKILSELITACQETDIGNITQIDLTDTANLKILYDGRITLELGAAVNIYSKLNLAKAVIDQGIESYEYGTLNLAAPPKANFVPSEIPDSSEKESGGASSQ